MRRSLLAVLLVLCLSPLSAQFNLVGDASLIGLGCFQLTPNNNNQLGAVWTSVPIDFSQGFDLVLEFNLGCNNNGENLDEEINDEYDDDDDEWGLFACVLPTVPNE